MLNVRHLAVFRAVMKTGSVSGAARMLNVSQPAVTKTLQLIEGRLGLPLFVRIKGRLHATPESLLLMPNVERIFGAVTEVEQLALEISKGHAGRVSIATVSTFSTSLVAAATASFRAKRANVLVDIRALPTRHVVEEVSSNQVDVGLLDVTRADSFFKSQELCVTSIGCVMPRDHRLAGNRRVTPDDLVGETLISFADDTMIGWMLRERLGSNGIPIEIALTTNQSLAACALAQSRVGLAIVDPFPMLTGLFPDLIVLPFEPVIETRPSIIFPPTRPISIVANEFVKAIHAAVDALLPLSSLVVRSEKDDDVEGV